ncbi:DegV family protein [Gudongella sp. DL1XJH-153]|uniref:DegV family protein n=1 Tax=Gudongella sp. DL1XJH-153 TaxID=3409804 RepID=UPI003BB581F6
MDYKIVADSSCDTNEQLDKFMEVHKVPFKIDIDERTFIDNEELDLEDMVKTMKESPNPIKSSCPSPGDFKEAYGDAENVFVVTISKELSGTYNSAELAKEMTIEENENQFVHVFNSKSASTGETLTAMKIQECVNKGMTRDEIVETVENYIQDTKTFFISEDLSNLIKNGRISKTAGLIANVLNIKPIMRRDEDGNIEPVEKIRGSKKAFKRLAEVIGENGSNFEERVIAISHANALDKAMELKKDIERYNFKEVIIVETKGLSTAYVNDGGIIVSF